MLIGKIISSSSHLNYICRVYTDFEITNPPQVCDYKLGQFVKTKNGTVGVIANFELFNPAFGNLGPRLTTPAQENLIFSPDYMNEQATLVHVIPLGALKKDYGEHSIPLEIISLNSEIYTLDEDEFKKFHIDKDGNFFTEYFVYLMEEKCFLNYQLSINIIENLKNIFTEQVAKLEILKEILSWNYIISKMRI